VDNGKTLTQQSLHDKGKSNRGGTKGTVELELKTVKCYKYHKDGHMAKSCPNAQTTKLGNKMIGLESTEPEEESTVQEAWMRIMTVLGEDLAQNAGAKLSGPTFKVNVEVEGVKTRTLLDNGSQVTLVRAELLPKIAGWIPNQRQEQDSSVMTQPIGASGQQLGATAVVTLRTVMEQTGQELRILCFVLESVKPIWQGVVHDCAMILGTNAMVEYGIQTVQGDGTILQPFSAAKPEKAVLRAT